MKAHVYARIVVDAGDQIDLERLGVSHQVFFVEIKRGVNRVNFFWVRIEWAVRGQTHP